MNSSGQTCFYDLLGVAPDASAAEIHAGYLQAARRWHPDLNQGSKAAERAFKQSRRIFELLSDPVQRANYDEDPSRFTLTETGIAFSTSKTIFSQPYRDGTTEDRRWADTDATMSPRSDTRLHPTSPQARRWPPISQFAVTLVSMTVLGLAVAIFAGLRIHQRRLEHGDANAPVERHPPRVVAANTSRHQDLAAESEPSVSAAGQSSAAKAQSAERGTSNVSRSAVQPSEISLSELPAIPKLTVVDALNAALPGSPPLISMPLESDVRVDFRGEPEPYVVEEMFSPMLPEPTAPARALPKPRLHDQSFTPSRVGAGTDFDLPSTPIANDAHPPKLPATHVTFDDARMTLPLHAIRPDLDQIRLQNTAAKTQFYGIRQPVVAPSGLMPVPTPTHPVSSFSTATAPAIGKTPMLGTGASQYPSANSTHAPNSIGWSAVNGNTMSPIGGIDPDPGSRYSLKHTYRSGNTVTNSSFSVGARSTPGAGHLVPSSTVPMSQPSLSSQTGWSAPLPRSFSPASRAFLGNSMSRQSPPGTHGLAPRAPSHVWPPPSSQFVP